jgi:nitrite reductase/ring-hydroxylating ferredoxin subunit
MIIMKRTGIDIFHKIFGLVILISLLAQYSACTPELSDDEIPYLPFSLITINLNLPEYQSLRTDGGYHYIEGGVRGIILYRQGAHSYIAYERNCSFHPNDACATVDVDISNLFMNDPCCGASFDFASGQPTGGPAWRPLRKYETLLTGSELTITDAIVE